MRSVTCTLPRPSQATGKLTRVRCSPGWLCEIKLVNPAEFNELLDEAAYKVLCEGA